MCASCGSSKEKRFIGSSTGKLCFKIPPDSAGYSGACDIAGLAPSAAGLGETTAFRAWKVEEWCHTTPLLSFTSSGPPSPPTPLLAPLSILSPPPPPPLPCALSFLSSSLPSPLLSSTWRDEVMPLPHASLEVSSSSILCPLFPGLDGGKVAWNRPMHAGCELKTTTPLLVQPIHLKVKVHIMV